MAEAIKLGGTFTFPGTATTVHRMGYGAMQLAGPHVFGPPRDRAEAIRVLRRVIEAGVDHIDTSDFYGPHVTNQIIQEALHPYRDRLVIVTKVGAKRGNDGSWIQIHTRESLIAAVHDNLRHLKLDVLDVVNLRAEGIASPKPEFDVRGPMEVLAELQQQGIIRHIGLSHVTPGHVEQASEIAPVVCVQNFYNLVNRADDAWIDTLSNKGIAYVPYFPLGGFTPLQSEQLNEVATSLEATPVQVALAWLLQRAPNVLLIPGTSSVVHLEENLKAVDLVLPKSALAVLDGIA